MRCLALDVGARRTGVAVGERFARPVTTLRRRSKAEDFRAIARLLGEHHAERLVIGLPLNMDGSMGFQAQRITRYAGRLKEALDEMGITVEMVFWDERLTTEEAMQVLYERDGRGSSADVDAVAAALILQSYLDAEPDAGCD